MGVHQYSHDASSTDVPLVQDKHRFNISTFCIPSLMLIEWQEWTGVMESLTKHYLVKGAAYYT